MNVILKFSFKFSAKTVATIFFEKYLLIVLYKNECTNYCTIHFRMIQQQNHEPSVENLV